MMDSPVGTLDWVELAVELGEIDQTCTPLSQLLLQQSLPVLKILLCFKEGHQLVLLLACKFVICILIVITHICKNETQAK